MDSNAKSRTSSDGERSCDAPYECGLDEKTFPFWGAAGGLREHWYALAFCDDVVTNKPLRQIVLGVPVVLWRDQSGTVNAFVDVCPHRQAQLSDGFADASGLSCPYHGWRFSPDGKCSFVPAATAGCGPRDAAQLIRFPVSESGGVLRVWMGLRAPSESPTDELAGQTGWSSTRSMQVLPFDLDDLVENFMDFAHTPVVHPGLIRSKSSASDRSVSIEIGETHVHATHEPVDEKVGPLSGLVLPRGPVKHRDSFFLPGDVRVEYGFGDQPLSFVAQLNMTPARSGQTLLLVTLNVRFGWMNPLIRLVLPGLMRKVLKQDIHILRQQRQNLDLLGQRKRRSLQADSVDAIVRAMREHGRDGSLTAPKPGQRQIQVRV